MPALTRPQKITLGEMQSSGVRGLLIYYCSDYRWGSGHQACDQPELASSSQRRVASSVQPGTAKRAPGAVPPWLGRTMACRGLEGCTVAALAEAHRGVNRT